MIGRRPIHTSIIRVAVRPVVRAGSRSVVGCRASFRRNPGNAMRPTDLAATATGCSSHAAIDRYLSGSPERIVGSRAHAAERGPGPCVRRPEPWLPNPEGNPSRARGGSPTTASRATREFAEPTGPSAGHRRPPSPSPPRSVPPPVAVPGRCLRGPDPDLARLNIVERRASGPGVGRRPGGGAPTIRRCSAPTTTCGGVLGDVVGERPGRVRPVTVATSSVTDVPVLARIASNRPPKSPAYASGTPPAIAPAIHAAFGGWDAAGAKSFGYPTVWVNRLGQPIEELDVQPDRTVTDLNGLLDFVLKP